MPFNPNVSKQYQEEMFFSEKTNTLSHPSVPFDNIPVQRTSTWKQSGVYLDEKFNFNTHIRQKPRKS